MNFKNIPGLNIAMSETVVTQLEWKRVMGTEPWKEEFAVREGDEYPATYVNWDDAVKFCEKLSGIKGDTYRLPTEAEWEYACRAGTITNYHFGDDPTYLGKYGWFEGNTWSIDEPYAHRVALKESNQFGLYDMHGNVWEWCGDWYDENQRCRVLRGGSWSNISELCSACFRSSNPPVNRANYIGFRLVKLI